MMTSDELIEELRDYICSLPAKEQASTLEDIVASATRTIDSISWIEIY